MKLWIWKCDDCGYSDYRYYYGLKLAKRASEGHKCPSDSPLAEANITYIPLCSVTRIPKGNS